VLMGAMMVGALGFLGPDYAFTLNARGRKEKVKAEFKDGVLNLQLPKSEKAKPKAIEVVVG